jgi:hypothetical protein
VTPETRAARDRIAAYRAAWIARRAKFTGLPHNTYDVIAIDGVRTELRDDDLATVLAALDALDAQPDAIIVTDAVLTEQQAEDLKRRFLAAQHDGTPVRVLDDPDAPEEPHRLTVRLIPTRGLHGEELGPQPYRELRHTAACDRLGYGQHCPFDDFEGPGGVDDYPTEPGEHLGWYWASKSWGDSGWEYDGGIEWQRADNPETSDESAKDTP